MLCRSLLVSRARVGAGLIPLALFSGSPPIRRTYPMEQLFCWSPRFCVCVCVCVSLLPVFAPFGNPFACL